MQALRNFILLCFAFLAVTTPAINRSHQSGAREGTYTFRINYIVWMLATVKLTAAGDGTFAVSGSLQPEDMTESSKKFTLSGTLNRQGNLRAKARIPGSAGEGSPVDGLWDAKLKTLVITRIDKSSVYAEGKLLPSKAVPKTGGTYRGDRLGVEFILSKTPNPDQLSVYGRSAEVYGARLEIRGTYYIKRNALTAFGEVRGREDDAAVKVDGKFEEGIFKVHYVVTIPQKGATLRDEWIDCVYEGRPSIPAPQDPNDRGTPERKTDPDPKPSRGSIKGAVKMDRASANIGDTLKLNLSYSLDGRDGDTVTESVALYGPDDALLARSDKERSLVTGSPMAKSFDIKCAKGGTYTVKVRVKGEMSAEWKDSASFTIKKADVREKPKRTANFGGEWDSSSGRMVLTQSGNGVKGTYTWMSGTIQGTVTGNKFTGTWEQTRNDRRGTCEFIMGEGDTSFSGFFEYTPKSMGQKGSWGGSRVGPAPKIDAPAAEEKPKPVSTSMVQTSTDDENKQIRARIDPTSLTLRAGEPSQIIDITISGFRTNTADRVEVLFPQATDGWASLPGQIVVGGGAGHYDPANMGRPEHTDGYFFSARSTAPDGKQTIEIIVRQKGAGQVKLTLDVTVIGREAAPVRGGDPWTATWNEGANPWNPLVLKRDGNVVTGTFWKGQATLKGTLDGDTLRFAFENFYGKKGKGELTLSDQGQRLAGHYYEDGDDTKWDVNFKRQP